MVFIKKYFKDYSHHHLSITVSFSFHESIPFPKLSFHRYSLFIVVYVSQDPKYWVS